MDKEKVIVELKENRKWQFINDVISEIEVIKEPNIVKKPVFVPNISSIEHVSPTNYVLHPKEPSCSTRMPHHQSITDVFYQRERLHQRKCVGIRFGRIYRTTE